MKKGDKIWLRVGLKDEPRHHVVDEVHNDHCYSPEGGGVFDTAGTFPSRIAALEAQEAVILNKIAQLKDDLETNRQRQRDDWGD